MNGVDRERVEEAARLEGLTFESALERRKGFRYLYQAQCNRAARMT